MQLEPKTPLPRRESPWTDEEVRHLNEFQDSGAMHPFTYRGHRPDGSEWRLIATNAGWIADEGGEVVQTWCFQFMADGSALENHNILMKNFLAAPQSVGE